MSLLNRVGTVRKHERKGRRDPFSAELTWFWWNQLPKSHQLAALWGRKDLTPKQALHSP